MFLTRENVISELKEDQVDSFIIQSLDNYNTIQNESPPYLICCNLVEPTIAFLMADVMLWQDFPPFVDYYNSIDFVNEGGALPDSIAEYARQFINQ